MKTVHAAMIGIVFLLAGCAASSTSSISSKSAVSPAPAASKQQNQETALLLMHIMTDMNDWAADISKLNVPPEAFRSTISDTARESVMPMYKEFARKTSDNKEFILAYDQVLEPESPYEISKRAVSLYKDKTEEMEMLMTKKSMTEDDMTQLENLYKECASLVPILKFCANYIHTKPKS